MRLSQETLDRLKEQQRIRGEITARTVPPGAKEHEIQSAFFAWVRLQEHAIPLLKLIFAVPNGGFRSKKTAAALKREGAKAGVPDVMFPLATHRYAGLALEFKRPKTGRLSDSQTDYIELLRAVGWRVEVVRSADEAINLVRDHINEFSNSNAKRNELGLSRTINSRGYATP